MFLFLFIGIKYTKDPVYSCELSPPLPDDASSDHTSLIIPVSGGVQVPNFTPGAGQPAATAAFLPAATPPPALPLLTTAAADIEPFVHLVTAPTVAVEHPETAGAVVGNRDTAERRQFNEDVLPVPIDPRRRQPVGRPSAQFERLAIQPTGPTGGDEFVTSGSRAASRAADATDSQRARARKRLRILAVPSTAPVASTGQPSRFTVTEIVRNQPASSSSEEDAEQEDDVEQVEERRSDSAVLTVNIVRPRGETVIGDDDDRLLVCEKRANDQRQKIEELENRTKLHIDYANEKQLEIEQLLAEIESLQNETALFEESVESFETEIRNVTSVLIRKDQDIIKLMEDNNLTVLNLRNIISEKERTIGLKNDEVARTNSTLKKLSSQLKALSSAKVELAKETREQKETVARLREEKDNLLRIVQQLARIGNPNITFATNEEPADYDEDEKATHAQRLATMLEQEITSTPTSSEVSSARPVRGSSDFPLDVYIVQKYVNSIREESAQLRIKTEEGGALPEDNAEKEDDFLADSEEEDDFLSASRENRGITVAPEESVESAEESTTTAASSTIIPQQTKTTEQEASGNGAAAAAADKTAAEEPATTIVSAAAVEDAAVPSGNTDQPAAGHRMEAILIEGPTSQEPEVAPTRLPALLLDEELHNSTKAAEETQLSPLEEHAAIENGTLSQEVKSSAFVQPAAAESSTDSPPVIDAVKEDAVEKASPTEAPLSKEDNILAEVGQEGAAREARQEDQPETPAAAPAADSWEGSFLAAINDHVAVVEAVEVTTSASSQDESTHSSNLNEEKLEVEMEAGGQEEGEKREERDYDMEEEEMAKMQTEAQLFLLSQEMMGGAGGVAGERVERDYRRDEAVVPIYPQQQRVGRQHRDQEEEDSNGNAQQEDSDDNAQHEDSDGNAQQVDSDDIAQQEDSDGNAHHEVQDEQLHEMIIAF